MLSRAAAIRPCCCASASGCSLLGAVRKKVQSSVKSTEEPQLSPSPHADDPEARRLALLARRPEEGGTAWLPYNALDALILRCRERGAHATGASDGDARR